MSVLQDRQAKCIRHNHTPSEQDATCSYDSIITKETCVINFRPWFQSTKLCPKLDLNITKKFGINVVDLEYLLLFGVFFWVSNTFPIADILFYLLNDEKIDCTACLACYLLYSIEFKRDMVWLLTASLNYMKSPQRSINIYISKMCKPANYKNTIKLLNFVQLFCVLLIIQNLYAW